MQENTNSIHDCELQTEFFQLRDGRCIESPVVSEKMYYIKSARPEVSYKQNDTGYTWDESGMADLFSECYNQDTRFCPEYKTWFTYDSGKWVRDVGSILLSRKIKEFARIMSLYCGEITDDETRKAYMEFIARLGDRRFRDRIAKDAEECLVFPASKFDSNPYLINCQNGTYNLQDGTFYENRWDDFCTQQTNFTYSLSPHKCSRWEDFISEVTQNDTVKADYLQRALGYSILGQSREECMFILYGKTTRNGKSTLLDAIQHMLGDYSGIAPVKMICGKGSDTFGAESASPVLASLRGKRFVTMAESSNTSKIDASVLKQFTGGEEITARALYEKPVTFTPQFTLWLSCNDLPRVHDESLFSSERLRVIEFTRHFELSERDKGLKDYFRTDEAMSGIFCWLVEGYRKYVELGLDMPQEIQDVVDEYRNDNDVVLRFLEDRCERDEKQSTYVKSLYLTYKDWASDNNEYVMTARNFTSRLLEKSDWYDKIFISKGSKKLAGLTIKPIVFW